MTIKQLLEMPIGKENRTGGFNLIVKTARKILERDEKYVQGVVFTDDTGDIEADVSLPRYNPLIRSQGIHITVCWLQPTSNGKKLYVEQWWPLTTTTEPDMKFKYQPDWGPEDSEVTEWRELHKLEIRGKIRNGGTWSCIEKGLIKPGMSEEEKKEVKEMILYWQDFIVTGK